MTVTKTRLPRRVIELSGPDGERFLNGLITNTPPAAGVRYAGLLTAQGKLVADFLVWRDGPERLLLDVAEARAEDLAGRLRRFRLRAKVEIGFAPLAVLAGEGEPDPRSEELPLRRLAPEAESPAFDAPAFAALEASRIFLGAPDPAVDFAPEEPFALEALFEELNGVDFHKGCFVGQENVSRMKRRATTRKKICRIAFEGPAPAFGAKVTAGAAELGDVRSGVEGAALAFLRLDRALEAVAAGVALTCEGRAVRLDPPPWLILPAEDPA